ncbi:MAG: hypothetical protein ACK4FB_07875 [Brevundimonas sp.]|uniref:hypothetical protein n=1 Tax=Brevundimonas sp. TaxID=1871086 RepID=UPI00391940B1
MTDHTALIERLQDGRPPYIAELAAAIGFAEDGLVHSQIAGVLYQSSIDAAIALADRVLDVRGPLNINICLAGSAQVQIHDMDPCGATHQAVASTPALAVVIALLRALQPKDGTNV